ncbi:MAG TPA: DUF5686 family protein [Chitinophagaceae bacterium]|nr:DUF5686 family protein [Chitinophagaceae bacterium]
MLVLTGVVFCSSFFFASAQTKVLSGKIRDNQSGELVPFASVRFKRSGIGKLADAEGNFVFNFSQWPKDTLEISFVGFKEYYYVFHPDSVKKDSLHLLVNLEAGKYNMGVVVTGKVNRGLQMWKRIVRRKPQNDRYRFNNFSYELYNKLEVDLKNIKKAPLQKIPLMKDFSFIFDNIDTTEEGVSFLPVYLTEAISHYYYQKNPLRRREVFKGTKTIGIRNESVTKLLGGMDQVVNFYNNFIPVFDKQFISPISDHGDEYYVYKVADTQYVSGRRFFHFFFTPRRKGENTFEGDCWVHDSTWAIQKMNLRLSKEANINYVNSLSLIQEYKLINDTTWFLARDKFVVDMSIIGDKRLSAIGRKTTMYKDVLVNNDKVELELAKNKLVEETILPSSAHQATDSFWTQRRHEELSLTERKVYQTVDTLLKMPEFKKFTNTVYFLTVGYKNIGNYEIGPWFNWVTYNVVEGVRTRFDLGTNPKFSKKIFLHGYLAYGFLDKQFKYKLDGTYLFKKNPRTSLQVAYKKDIDNGQNYYDEISQDNIFALAARKAGVPLKYMKVDEKKIDYLHEWKNGFSTTITGLNKTFDPLLNLPPRSAFVADKRGVLTTSEVSIRIRYAFLEKFLESSFNRISLGSPYPIGEIKFTKGISNVFNSGYDYSKISAAVSQYKKIPPFGSIYYNVFGGKTFGTLPYMMLDLAPGNEIYYYNKYAFNLMNKYQYLHNEYAGINFEHNIGNGVFRFVPLLKKLKFRQFYSARALRGTLSAANRSYNMPAGSPHQFESLNGKTYLEVGTGVDNILKVMRFDFIWLLAPHANFTPDTKRFGIFGSFRMTF